MINLNSQHIFLKIKHLFTIVRDKSNFLYIICNFIKFGKKNTSKNSQIKSTTSLTNIFSEP